MMGIIGVLIAVFLLAVFLRIDVNAIELKQRIKRIEEKLDIPSELPKTDKKEK